MSRRIVLCDYEISPALVSELAQAQIEIVATIDGHVESVPRYSWEDLFACKVRVPIANRSHIMPVPAVDLRKYSRCISRIGHIPGADRLEVHDGGMLEVSEIEHLASLHFSQAFDILSFHQAEELWFTTRPHLGLDLAFEYAARQLGLRVLILRQLTVPMKFGFEVFQGTHRLNVSKLDFSPWQHGAKPLDLFYMKPRQWESTSSAWVRRVRDFRTLLRGGRWREVLSRIWRAQRDRQRWERTFLLMLLDRRTHRQLATHQAQRREWLAVRSQRRMASAEDYMRPFIYFPLHYEPEANSDVFSEWPTQVDALEALAASMPADWLLLLKENPKQLHVRRNAAFYMRIARLGCVRWAPDSMSSAELLDRCRLPATLIGTVGWEALQKGRNCLYMGEAWYAGLPGTIAWHPGLDLSEIPLHMVDPQSLHAEVNRRLTAAADGLVVARYAALLPPEMDRETAARITARSLIRICAAADQSMEGGNEHLV